MRRPQNSFWILLQPQKYPIWAPKSQKWPKNRSKSNVRIEGNIENENCSTTRVDPKTVFEPYPDPKNSPFGPKTVKNDSKIKAKLKSQSEVNMENKSSSTTSVDPKTVFEPYIEPKIAH